MAIAIDESKITYSGDGEANLQNFDVYTKTEINNAVQGTSSLYDESTTYTLGSYCIYNNTLYRSTTAITTPEPFTSSHWESVSLSAIHSNPFNLFNGFESSSAEYKEALWGLHNGIYRGACLYDAINNRAGRFSSIDAIQEAVSAGDFSDIYIGDYILFNITTSYGGTESVKDCVGGINYYLNHGGIDLQLTTNHLLLIPEHTLSTYLKMNTTDTTETGYINSNMAKTILPEYGTAFNTALGGHTLNFLFYCSSAGTTESTWNKITNEYGGSSKWNQGNDNIILPSEMAVFGGVSASSTIYDTGSFSSQLPYFALRPDKIPARQGYNGTSNARFWCLGVATKTSFVTCFLNGMPDFERCTREDVCIRPIVLFG